MLINKMFGKKCARCGDKRTKTDFEGLPTCEKCALGIRADREEVRPCPACTVPMEKMILLNLIVDKCPECRGAWLDGGELDLIKEAIKGGAGDNFATGMVVGMAMG